MKKPSKPKLTDPKARATFKTIGELLKKQQRLEADPKVSPEERETARAKFQAETSKLCKILRRQVGADN